MLIIDINNFLNPDADVIQLINIYNEKSLSENSDEWTVKRSLKKIILNKNIIICGDFNSHHLWWNLAILELNFRKVKNLVK